MLAARSSMTSLPSLDVTINCAESVRKNATKTGIELGDRED